MNWITNFVRPKIQALMQKTDTPENLWTKCPSCEQMLFQKDLMDSLFVCSHCDHHLRMNVSDRLNMLFEDKNYLKATLPKVPTDPLRFKDSKKYVDRLKSYRNKTGTRDAIVVASGKIGTHSVVIAAFDFRFMGGSMGMAVGEGLLTAAELAVRKQSCLIAIPASGGARMQEGALSLMQMPRSIIAVEKVKEAGLPYITLLTDPTTGGVAASFAMLGDIALAEPGAMIGFAGARVIEQTIRHKLPQGFQKSEYLLDHGMVDRIIHRHQLKASLVQLLGLIQPKRYKHPKESKYHAT